MIDKQGNAKGAPEKGWLAQAQVCNNDYVFTVYITPELSLYYLETPLNGMLVSWVRSCLMEQGRKISVRAALVRTAKGELYLANPVAYQ